ncbi:hypothetical protein U1Q18_017465 [Sarracenia purpurea var. burkii]
MERGRPKNQQIGGSKSDVGRCKKHPKHRQSPGVCSVCLTEKLSRLPTTSRSHAAAAAMAASSSSSSSSSLSSLSSHYSSSELSPVRTRLGSELKASSVSFFRSINGKNFLTKSWSVASSSSSLNCGSGSRSDHGDGKKKGIGFWGKLVRARSKKMDGSSVLMHSRTVREMITITTKVH